MDQAEFDEMIDALTNFVESARQNKIATSEESMRFFSAVVKATGPEFDSIIPRLADFSHGDSFDYDRALKRFAEAKQKYRAINTPKTS